MNYIKLSIALLATMLLAAACQNDGFYYQDVPRVRIVGPSSWTLGTDSLQFSFVTYPADTTEKQLNVTLWVMGNATEYDRTANLEVLTDKTTASADLYRVPASVVIAAGANSATFPVILKRAASLQQTTARLYIAVQKSADFEVGISSQDHLLLKWNDILSKPSNWTSLQEFFGSYSDVKYRFMINNAGISEFDTTTMTWAELQYYKIKLVNALNKYNQEHPEAPLTDETGKLVSFDN
ncbi:MAG: hypothetical protein H6Q14_956 [Bacteroidetes bacterium]|nr:hypothetical protein [Bacteroidota bacterium]